MKKTITVLSTLCLFTFTRSETPSSGYGPPSGGGDYKHEFTFIKDSFDMHPLILRDAENNYFQIAMMKVMRKHKKKPSKFDFGEHYFSPENLEQFNFLNKKDEINNKSDDKNDTTHFVAKNESNQSNETEALLNIQKIESRKDNFSDKILLKNSRIQKRSFRNVGGPYLKISSKPVPNPYEFGYKVKDDYSGSKFHQQEASDGNQVRGEYRVELPDGRTQIVTYWADWQTGFHADVKYEGKAKFPPTPPKYGPPSGGGGNGGYNYPAPSAPGNTYGAP